MSKRIVVCSDIQFPYHNRKQTNAVIRFIGDTQPDEVVLIGDCMDYPQPSRWSKGTRGEFEGSVYKDSEKFQTDVLEPLRAVYDGHVGMHEGNHDLRPREYLAKNAPALSDSADFNIENLLRFGDFDVRLLPDFYDVAPGWVSTHGHLASMSLSRLPGYTALNAAVKFGKSVVCGHTHRLGIGAKTTGVGGKVSQQLFGMEVGHLMDQKKAAYLKGGTANWQAGFGLLTVDGNHVKPEIIPITAGKFSVDGETWKV